MKRLTSVEDLIMLPNNFRDPTEIVRTDEDSLEEFCFTFSHYCNSIRNKDIYSSYKRLFLHLLLNSKFGSKITQIKFDNYQPGEPPNGHIPPSKVIVSILMMCKDLTELDVASCVDRDNISQALLDCDRSILPAIQKLNLPLTDMKRSPRLFFDVNYKFRSTVAYLNIMFFSRFGEDHTSFPNLKSVEFFTNCQYNKNIDITLLLQRASTKLERLFMCGQFKFTTRKQAHQMLNVSHPNMKDLFLMYYEVDFNTMEYIMQTCKNVESLRFAPTDFTPGKVLEAKLLENKTATADPLEVLERFTRYSAAIEGTDVFVKYRNHVVALGEWVEKWQQVLWFVRVETGVDEAHLFNDEGELIVRYEEPFDSFDLSWGEDQEHDPNAVSFPFYDFVECLFNL